MKTTFKHSLLVAGLVFLFTLFPAVVKANGCCPALDDDRWSRHALYPGVALYQHHFESLFDESQYVNLLLVNLNESRVELRFAAAVQFGEKDLSLSALGSESGAIAAINGGFMHGGPDKTNSGILKIDGEVLPFLRGEPEELRFVGSSALGIDSEGNWHFMVREREQWDTDWPDVEHAMAGGHILIRDGEIYPAIDEELWEGELEKNHAGNRHPRTALGVTPNNMAVLITVDGRHEQAGGVTLRELAQLLQALGCEHAINLDGGGSTAMWTRELGVVNHPSDNRRFDAEGLRNIRSAVIVRENPDMDDQQ